MAPTSSGFSINLTKGESDRILGILEARIEKCSNEKGRPRPATVRHDLISSATQASLMADMSGEADPGITANNREGAITIIGFPAPYSPCTTPVEDLESISLRDLQIETHHRGRRLRVKRVAPVNHLNAYSWTVVEDNEGDVERLEVHLHKAKRGEDVFDVMEAFDIKDPYMTLNEQGQPVLRVHHPSDLCPVEDAEVSPDHVDNASKWKSKGNEALKKKELYDAFSAYTTGIKIASKDEGEGRGILRDLQRNRAHVGLLLGRFDQALNDAEASLIGSADEDDKKLDGKAHFRAGNAAYNLGRFEEAERHFTTQVELVPDDAEGKSFLRLSQARVKGQAEGKYDLTKLANRVTPTRPKVDVASYVTNVEVKSSSLAGNGLFATRDINHGDIVFCEKALHVAWSHAADSWLAMVHTEGNHDMEITPVGMAQAVVQKLQNNPSLINSVLALHSDHPGTGREAPLVDGEPVIDTFQIKDIIGKNAFGPGDFQGQERPNKSSVGLWIVAAYANHSCVPNAEKAYVGDLMILRATKSIKAGEEITHSYMFDPDFNDRQGQLKRVWGFECNCPLCKAESSESDEMLAQRREINEKVQAFVHQEQPQHAKRVVIARGQRLANSLEKSYNPEKYKDLARPVLEAIQQWLSIAKSQAR